MAPVATRKRLSGPPWDDIAANYPHAVRRHLAELASISGGGDGGKLIIWHGPPGTGKTTALRSLIRSWQPWCGMHYIIDPERFFAHPGYMVELLATSSSPARSMTVNAHDDATGDRWQLVVAEDCNEYLRATARRDAGAALGLLLNLSDGILGQGHRTLILLTTNEELHRLHPALTRPGRCLAVIEFAKFEPAEARHWLESDVAPPTTPSTLAELYEHSGQITRLNHDEPRPAGSGHYL
jgi:ATPase family associated with various cellular activities (AAA)